MLNPRCILIINTIPISILFFLFYGQFTIIHSLLEDTHIMYWKTFGGILFIVGFLNLLYTLFLIAKKKKVSFFYGIIALLVYIPFIYIYHNYTDEIIPFSIPQWMVSSIIVMYTGTFLMPTLIYSLFIIVLRFTPKNKKHNALINFVGAIAVPISWYIFSQVILPFWKAPSDDFSMHAFLIFLIVGTILFLFFVIRGIFILITKKASVWRKYELVWKIPIAIIFPILGLAVNNSGLSGGTGFVDSGIFGDFNNPWFYVLAILNGILICLPNYTNIKYQVFLLIGRSVTFSYSLYFFIVFLPFLPLSVIAIIAIGTGFLMLTPLLLFMIHIQELTKGFALLRNHFSIHILRTISIISFLIIPICLTIQYKLDQNTLEETLDYIHNPDYSKQYSINKNSLAKTISILKGHKEGRRGDFLNERQTPYLSSFYNWIVLGNLSLSEAKIATIEHIFSGIPVIESQNTFKNNSDINISNIISKSTYDPSQNAWRSWIDLEIYNDSNAGLKEYATTFTLPDGCWISDYYLYVGDRKEMGILAEKKSALWVFSQIRNENRDPGILYYLTANKIAFKIFPFSPNETRKTGIEFLHKDPVTLNIDGHEIKLGHKQQQYINDKQLDKNNSVIYVSSQEKEKLKEIKRTPYFHFLVDASFQKEKYIQEFSNRIKKLRKENKQLSKNAQVSFINTYTSSVLDDNWEEVYKEQSFEGGFYLDRAIKTTLYNSYKNNTSSYPIMVVVTDSLYNAVLKKDFSDFKITFPENNEFYNLSEDGILQPHSLLENPKKQITDTIQNRFNKTVLEYTYDDNNKAYLPNNNEPTIFLKNGRYKATEDQIVEKSWDQALHMQAMWISQTLFPESSKKEWLPLVKHSFISKVMSPVTSYLVVENEAQKAILKKKQEQILSGNKDLDIGEDTPRMSEPSILIMLLLFGCYYWYRKKQPLKKS